MGLLETRLRRNFATSSRSAPIAPPGMKRFSLSQLLLTLAVAVVLWLLIASACLFMGSGGWGLPASRYILQVRAQSIGLASLVGAALGAAGVAYQAVLRNPLADPYLLGVSSGASLASYLWRVPGI